MRAGRSFSSAHAYRKRKIDAGFRAGWMEAIGVAYQRLELVLLDRAFNGRREGRHAPRRVRRADGRISTPLALSLLKMHRDTAVEANAEVAEDDVNEIRRRLIGKLERLKKRRKAAAGT